MEGLINFIIILVIIFAVLTRLKKATKSLQNKGQPFVRSFGMVVPPSVGLGSTPLGLNSGNLDKITKVYGVGAMLGIDEVSILLNVSPETAQRHLEQLASQGRAEIVPSTSGKFRYKLR